ncbi:hypothetical protein BH23BAC1_BH23BAC1_29520 [soil metagenome]
MNAESKKFIESYITSYNHFDIERMLEDLAENIEFENISNGKSDLKIQGKQNFRDQAVRAAGIFSERKQTILTWKEIQHGDFEEIEIDIDYYGKLSQDLPNGLKKGAVLELKGKSIFKIEVQKIKSIQDYS